MKIKDHRQLNKDHILIFLENNYITIIRNQVQDPILIFLGNNYIIIIKN